MTVTTFQTIILVHLCSGRFLSATISEVFWTLTHSDISFTDFLVALDILKIPLGEMRRTLNIVLSESSEYSLFLSMLIDMVVFTGDVCQNFCTLNTGPLCDSGPQVQPRVNFPTALGYMFDARLYKWQ